MPSKSTVWAARREGTLNKFYTRADVGELMVHEIGAIFPRSILDLGAGEGSLSAAAICKWRDAAVTTVDLDPSCVDRLQQRLREAGCRNHKHHMLDVLDLDVPAQLGEHSFDLAVCNPPFFRPEWKDAFSEILGAADISEACPTIADASAELLFLAQSLRLLKAGGTMALIIPDGLATGRRWLEFRRTLLKRHSLRTILQLPPYSFFETEAHCFILILDKGAPSVSKKIKLVRLYETGEVSEPIYVDPKRVEVRFDHSYHSIKHCQAIAPTSLRQIGADIRRGSLTSVQRKVAEGFVFHTGDFPTDLSPISLMSEMPVFDAKRTLVVEAGDILMARVDRDLHNKVALVKAGRAVITDCVYRIRVPERHRMTVFEALTSERGRAKVRAATKGVGARLIGKGDLLDLPIIPIADAG